VALDVNKARPMRIALLSLGISLVAVGCAQPDGGDDSDDDAAFAAIPQMPHAPACTGSIHCFAQVQTQSSQIQAFAAPQGFGPSELIDAYHVKALGTAATIAVVDAYDYANAESDLAKYRTQFGLPACTTANGCFKRVNQSGKASPLPGKAPAGDDWTVEAALDLDMASAACPSCKLILVEAQDDEGDGLYLGNDGAATLGATVVSNSWGGIEDGTESTLETHFNHAGVGYFASTGDSGFDNGGDGPQYPATSAHVTAVGGTSLVVTANTRGYSEKAWADGGANCSTSIARPSFQPKISQCAKRYNSDVSAVADPNTGVAVFNKGSGGWIVVGGTSASSPFVAGVMALYGLGAQGPGYAYAHATEYFDVHSGKDGTCGNVLCKAGVGWDGPTGIGTPNGHNL
jgi:subtilase family serine protease